MLKIGLVKLYQNIYNIVPYENVFQVPVSLPGTNLKSAPQGESMSWPNKVAPSARGTYSEEPVSYFKFENGKENIYSTYSLL